MVILSKKTDESPYTSFMGKGVIDLPPQTVFESVRNPQLRFTYDNMLKVRVRGCSSVDRLTDLCIVVYRTLPKPYTPPLVINLCLYINLSANGSVW